MLFNIGMLSTNRELHVVFQNHAEDKIKPQTRSLPRKSGELACLELRSISKCVHVTFLQGSPNVKVSI